MKSPENVTGKNSKTLSKYHVIKTLINFTSVKINYKNTLYKPSYFY
ncbi:conserved hypothetical protein [Xenorhabdus bovienii str. Jollieti]|uniref:Uncharacterized protein n=7 Tax=Xenorhabdus bovienii TaxID=40576 RepID=A0A077PET4_XENBV|nr:conserved hypothetical protein [Xenorhabdus bovienii str. feltiae France]CDG90930.1 conserved hypothetical protein [Xenorhabdus bovienii str. feltiae Florida]CDG98408.1 conserved hypothetical protein [Xenorhabdus bovienii str. puntauvense]CDH00718.1 conserved hypothetical protein [Xenorhabdus bovienii str. feltiae Moldova]CDH08180.1 conserved hypothetical protein [Xenorhabdus bovienii str. oregonense]CDH19122.1 conserved hypothetical protein [Xenorhabdus bovienii str. kraussei Quebec]CDH26